MRYTTKSLILVTALLLAMAAVALAPVARAMRPSQDGSGLSVSNAKLELTLPPGQSYVHNMVVALGPQAQPLDITVEPRGFGESLEGSFMPLAADQDTSPYSARTFVTAIDNPSFRLEPGGSQPVSVTFTLPADAGPDPRYAIIFIASEPVSTGTAVANIIAASVPVVITPAGAEIRHTGTISDLKVNAGNAGEPLEIVATVKNTGNHHYRALSQAVLLDASGQTVATVTSPPASTSIIPTYTQQLKATYAALDRPEGLPAGNYTASVKATLEDGTLLDSRETAFVIAQPFRPLPEIPLEDLVIVSYRDEVPGIVDARAKAGVEIAFSDTGKVTGQVAVGKYRQEPSGSPAFSAPVADGGLGTTALKYIGAQVSGFDQGVAQFTVLYTPAELAGADPNSLYLAYRSGDYWRKLDKLAVFSGAGTVQGEIAVNQLTKGAVIALAGGIAAEPAATGSTMILPIAGGIAVLGVVLALAAGVLLGRRKQHTAG
jgi:hypothetical protein